jgi:hypothetical protein
MTHLHAGALASKRESGSDCEYAADELDKRIAYGLASVAAAYRSLDLGNAATSRIWRDPTNQPRRDRRRGRGAGDDKQEPYRPLAMRQGDEPVA